MTGVLEELGHGAGTVNQIEERLSRRIRDALERLRKRGDVIRDDNLGGKADEFVYRVPPLKRRL
jgi:hypothetical protein